MKLLDKIHLYSRSLCCHGANGFAVLPLLLQMLSAAAVYEKNRLWAWILLAPSFFAVLWIIGVALFYSFS